MSSKVASMCVDIARLRPPAPHAASAGTIPRRLVGDRCHQPHHVLHHVHRRAPRDVARRGASCPGRRGHGRPRRGCGPRRARRPCARRTSGHFEDFCLGSGGHGCVVHSSTVCHLGIGPRIGGLARSRFRCRYGDPLCRCGPPHHARRARDRARNHGTSRCHRTHRGASARQPRHLARDVGRRGNCRPGARRHMDPPSHHRYIGRTSRSPPRVTHPASAPPNEEPLGLRRRRGKRRNPDDVPAHERSSTRRLRGCRARCLLRLRCRWSAPRRDCR